MKKLKIIGLLLIYCTSAIAQQVNLPQLIDLAIKNNKSIALSLKNVDYQKSLINTAYDLPKAMVELQYGSIQEAHVKDYSLSAVQYFDLPKVYALRKKYNESFVKIGLSELELQKQQLQFQISNIYYELTYFSQLENVYRAEVDKLNELLKIAQSKYSQGDVDKSDVIGLSLKIKEIEVKNNRLKIDVKRQNTLLSILLGNIAVPSLKFENANSLLINENSLANNKAINVQNEVINSAEINTQNEKTKLLPSLKAGITNQSMMGFSNQFVGMGGVEIPIFKKAQKSRIEASKINTESKKMELEKIEFELKTELDAAINRVTELVETKQIYADQLIPQNQLLMDLITKKYHAGSVSYLDWNLPYAQFLANKIESLQLEKELNLNYSIIKYLKGDEIYK